LAQDKRSKYLLPDVGNMIKKATELTVAFLVDR
jgi:hypothetical protein